MKIKRILQSCVVSACLASPVIAQDAPDLQGYWSGGYVDGNGGQIQFLITVVGGYGTLQYDTSNWGDLGYAICEYVFPVENGVPGALTRNSGMGSDNCVAEPSFTVALPNPQTMAVTFANPEFALDVVELGGVLRPFDPAQAHAPVAGLDILGITTGMTLDQIDPVLSEKGYRRVEDRDRLLEYNEFTIDQTVWGKGEDEYGNPTDWVVVTFSSKKQWAPDDVPVATDVAREWNIPESEGISGTTMQQSLEKKYGPRSNQINEDRYYDRAGQVLADSYGCPAGVHQPVRSNYSYASEVGEEDVSVECGPVLKAFIGTDVTTGRANLLKIRITDPDPVWADFWTTWSRNEETRLKSVYDGVTGATGAAPEL